MLTNLIIPEKFDAKKIIDGKENAIAIDSLNYICHSIAKHYFTYKDKEKKKEYAPLCSEILRKIIPNYSKYLKLLLENGVIISNNHFIVGKSCRGYKFSHTFIENGFKTIQFQTKRVKRIVQRELYFQKCKTPILLELERSRMHLINWLKHPGFKIDIPSAQNAIKLDFENKQKENLNNFRLEDIELYRKKFRDILLNTRVIETLILQINTKQFGTTIDGSGYRLHTPLTRLPKFLRPFLTFNGEKLVSLDIRNSQPYFTLLLLCNRAFYNIPRGKKEKFRLGLLDNELYNLIKPTLPLIRSITLQKFPEALSQSVSPYLKNYISDVTEGKLYDRFVKKTDNKAEYEIQREKIKKEFMISFYHVANNIPSRKFSRVYKEPFMVFNHFKSVETGRFKERVRYKKLRKARALEVLAERKSNTHAKKSVNKNLLIANEFERIKIDVGYTKLSTLLQKIESTCVLDVVCKKINEKNPEVPLFTIHDSIITTYQNVELVRNTMLTEIGKVIGHNPTIKTEIW